MHHHLMFARLNIALVVVDIRMFDPEIEPVQPAISDHFVAQGTLIPGIEGLQPLEQRVPVPIRDFYGICFPVHVELNACHGSKIG